MPTPLPTSYDWSSTQAPSGPFGVSPIPGAGSVFDGLSGAGALGTSGIFGIFNRLGRGGFDLSNVNRFAGSLGSLLGPGFDMEAATKELDKRAKETTEKIDERISNIYPGLTGKTGEQALNEYYQNFADTVAKVQNQGRTDLGISPEIATEYDRLGSRVDNIQNQYSLAGRLGGYDKLALEPPVVSMDVSSIRKAADWMSPEMASQFGMMTDYSGPQSSRFIYGGNRTADAIGKYYNTSGDVAGLMNYGTLA